MKCARCQSNLTRYLDRDVTAEERIEIETHLLACEECAQLLERMMTEEEVIRHVLTMPPLPESLTDAILAKVEPYGMPNGQWAVSPLPARRRKRVRANKGKAIAISAAILLFITCGAFVSPSFAEYLSSFISRIGGELGVKLAAEQGYSKPVNAAITSQGYTLRVKDIVADPTRLVATFVIEDEKGAILPDLWIPTYGENKIYLTDSAGNRLTEGVNFQRGNAFADFVFDLDNPPDQLRLHLSIKEFGSQHPVKVDWQLDVPVDISASKKVTSVVPIKASFVTPQGITFQLNQIVYAPSATQLTMTAELTEEAKERYRREAETIPGIRMDRETVERYGSPAFTYHLEDAQGKVVLSSVYGSYDPNGFGNIYLTPGKAGWKGSFVPMPTSETLYFVLDSVDLIEPARFSMKVSPAALGQKPASGEYLGNRYTVKSIAPQTDPQTKEESMSIVLEGTLQVSHFSQWAVLDEKGTEYPVEIDYANTQMVDNNFTQTLLVKGMKKVPKELTLVMKTIGKRYTDFDWKAPIPVKEGN